MAASSFLEHSGIELLWSGWALFCYAICCQLSQFYPSGESRVSGAPHPSHCKSTVSQLVSRRLCCLMGSSFPTLLILCTRDSARICPCLFSISTIWKLSVLEMGCQGAPFPATSLLYLLLFIMAVHHPDVWGFWEQDSQTATMGG